MRLGARAAVEARRVAEENVRKQAEQEAHGQPKCRRPSRAGARRPARRSFTVDQQPAFRSGLMEPGTVFRDVDAAWCPELVVIPPGEFMMGSTEAERQWAVDQGVDESGSRARSRSTWCGSPMLWPSADTR